MRLFVLTLIASVIVSCSTLRTQERAPALAGGFPARAELGFSHSVIHYSTDHGQCTGVLIRQNVMLTAAHCWAKAARYLVAFYFSGPKPVKGQDIPAANYSVIKNPYARVDQSAHDLALVVFGANVLPSDMQPMPVIANAGEDSVTDGQTIYLAGAGRTNPNTDGLGGNPLNVGTGAATNVGADQFGVTLGNSAEACNGDSGGPGMIFTSQGYIVVGIHSAIYVNPGQKCAPNPDFARFTAEDLEWISQSVN